MPAEAGGNGEQGGSEPRAGLRHGRAARSVIDEEQFVALGGEREEAAVEAVVGGES